MLHRTTGRSAGPGLLVATGNRGKLEEIRLLLAGVPVQVQGLGDVVPALAVVVEDGTTFAANAIKKARAAAGATGMLSLADDSGLEVDALDRRPGVRSARFAREDATDAENNAALLAALCDSGRPAPFHACFRCVVALVDPHACDCEAPTAEGVCRGTIIQTPRGTAGFGYDPIFVVEGTEKTMAELTVAEKNSLSHRARALSLLRPLLARTLAKRRT
jgi:XTP/dITP diphosphohydrolase